MLGGEIMLSFMTNAFFFMVATVCIAIGAAVLFAVCYGIYKTIKGSEENVQSDRNCSREETH